MAGICKLILKAYSDNSFSSEKGEYVSTINPTNLNISSNVSHSQFYSFYNTNFLRYNHSEPRVLSFSLCLDNSGVFPNSGIEIKQQLASLEGLFGKYQKDINEPYYVRVIWGTLDFKGRLKKMFVNYSYINDGGIPVRAQVDLEIIEQVLDIAGGSSQKELKNDKKSEKSSVDGNKSSSGSEANSAKSNGSFSNSENKQVENNIASDDDLAKNNEINEDENVINETDNKNESRDDKNSEEANGEDSSKDSSNTSNDSSESGSESNEVERGNGKSDLHNSDDVNSKQVMVKAGDSFPGIISEALQSSGMSLSKISDVLKSAVCCYALYNMLDTLRKLVAGSVTIIPAILNLIKKLIARAKAFAKRGVAFVKKKSSSSAKKVSERFNSAKGKVNNSFTGVKNGFNNVKNRVTN